MSVGRYSQYNSCTSNNGPRLLFGPGVQCGGLEIDESEGGEKQWDEVEYWGRRIRVTGASGRSVCYWRYFLFVCSNRIGCSFFTAVFFFFRCVM